MKTRSHIDFVQKINREINVFHAEPLGNQIFLVAIQNSHRSGNVMQNKGETMLDGRATNANTHAASSIRP